MQNSKNTMMFVTQMENGKKSFGLISISLDSPFLEVRFSLEHKILTIMTKTPTKEYKIIPKLDSNGNPKQSKVNKEGMCFERVEVDAFYSYTVVDKLNIVELVNHLDSSITAELLEPYFLVEPVQVPVGKVAVPDGVNLKIEK